MNMNSSFLNCLTSRFIDSNYSRMLNEEGAHIPSDVDSDFQMELPPWAEEERIKK